MKKIFTKTVAMALALMMSMVFVPISAQAEVPGLAVNTNATNARGGAMRYIELSGDYSFVPQVVRAVGGHALVSDMLDFAKQQGNVVAAFNGPFFVAGEYPVVTSLTFDSSPHGWGGSTLVYTNDGRWEIRSGGGGTMAPTTMSATNYPTLVQNGVKDIRGSDEVDFMAATAQRTLVGLRADNTLIIAEGSMNFETAADTLIDMGAMHGFAMDGGASSFIYGNGSMVRNPGRPLPHIIVIYATFPISSSPNSYGSEITVTVNGQPVVFADQNPEIVDGRTLVPVAGVFQALGFEVEWNHGERQAVITRGTDTVLITVGRNTFTKNGVDSPLDVPAQIINERTMLPIAAVLQSLGYTVNWESASRTVAITEGDIIVTPSA